MHVNLKWVLISAWVTLLFVSHIVNDVLKSLIQDYRTFRQNKITDISVVSSHDCDQDKDYLHAFMLRLCREWSLSSQNHAGDLWNMTILRHSWLLIGIVSRFKRAIRLHLQQWHTYNKQVYHTVWTKKPKGNILGFWYTSQGYFITSCVIIVRFLHELAK